MKFARTGFLLSLVLALTNTAAAKDRIGDFSLLDDRGKFHQLSYYGDYQAVAVLVSGLSGQADKEQLSAFGVGYVPLRRGYILGAEPQP